MTPRRRIPDPDDPRLREPGQRHAPLFVISVAAQLAEMHPQTLRQYDRIGLVIPKRQGGRHRRYSPHDVEQLREIQRLSQEGVSLEGIRRIIELENRVEALSGTVDALRFELREAQRHSTKPRFFAVGPYGEAEPVDRGRRPRGASRSLTRTQTQALVVWDERSRRR